MMTMTTMMMMMMMAMAMIMIIMATLVATLAAMVTQAATRVATPAAIQLALLATVVLATAIPPVLRGQVLVGRGQPMSSLCLEQLARCTLISEAPSVYAFSRKFRSGAACCTTFSMD